ncbi:MAG: YIP1 family protein [Paracoccaceae bacterium]|nr:MAG: YIP1 family protein [Paracoccaceae bacterium]
MDVTLSSLLTMARDSVSDPRGGARRVMAVGLPLRDAWSALMLMAVASAVLTHLGYLASPPMAQDFLAEAMSSPIRTAILQWVVMGVGAWAMYWFGAARGGHGTLPQAVSLAAWLQFILLVLQVVQLVAQVILPPLAGIIGIAGVVLFFWLLTNFVAEMHGFRSLPLTFLGVLAAMVVLVMIMAIAFGLLFGVPGQEV